MQTPLAEQAPLKAEGGSSAPAAGGAVPVASVIGVPLNPPRPVHGTLLAPPAAAAVPVARAHPAGPLVTRLSAAALASMLLSSICGLLLIAQYTRATTTGSGSEQVCSPTTGTCTSHYFNGAWCSPGDIESWSTYTTSGGEDSAVSVARSAEPEPLPCPDGRDVNPDLCMVEGAIIAVCMALGLGLMSVFPGCCSCDLAHGCGGQTACRILSVVLAWVIFGCNLAAGSFVGWQRYEGRMELSGMALVAFVIILPISSFALMTAARCISQSKEGEGAASGHTPPAAADNAKHCAAIGVVMAVFVLLGPIVHAASVVDGDATEGGWGRGAWVDGGCGDMGPPGCWLATEVQYWDCGCPVAPVPTMSGTTSTCAQGEDCGGQQWTDCGTSCPLICGQRPAGMCNMMCNAEHQCPNAMCFNEQTGSCESGAGSSAAPGQLRTIGVGGAAPDAGISQVVKGWVVRDRPEPANMSIHTTYPWLNPTCQDIGQHSGQDFCRGDAAALAASQAEPSVEAVGPTRGVPRSCTSWNDGCNSCSASEGVLGACTEMGCSSYGSPFCSRFEDGTTCASADEAGCDPSTHAGAITYDWQTNWELQNLVAGWVDACPTASADTCTATTTSVECVVNEPQVVCGRPFLLPAGHDAGGVLALRAAAVVSEATSDWLGEL